MRRAPALMDGQLTFDELEPPAPSATVVAVSAELTAAQRDAVVRRGHSLLLTATAGSGKTRVLVERFVAAVLEDEIAPERVLAITFTEKAAQELSTRVRERFTALGAREAARGSEAALITTIHGFCASVLRSHPLAAGLDPEFEVCDDATARRLRRRAFDAALHAFLAGEAGVAADRALDVVASFGQRRIEHAIDSVHERLRSRGEPEPRLPTPRPRLIPEVEIETNGDEGNGARAANGSEPPPRESKRIEAAAVELASELDALLRAHTDAYRRLKRARGLVDFDDLELEALALLRGDPGLRATWSERFELIMVDEFQDTNPRQVAMLELVERDNVFVVGDEFQSIYGFRFAEPGLLRRRREALAAQGATAELLENFRSRPEILAAINAAFEHRFGDRFAPLQPARAEPQTAAGDPRVELIVTDSAGWDGVNLGPGAIGGSATWRRAEARAMAGRVAELIGTGAAAPGETIVLLRAGTSMAIYERALIEAGLHTLAIGGGFWEALEVGDLIAYLRALVNPLDTLALYTLLASPLVGASPDALALIGHASQQLRHDPYRVLRAALTGRDDAAAAALAPLDGDDQDLLTALVAAFESERRAASRLGVDALITRVLDASGYGALLQADLAAPRRLANVQKLKRIARRFEAREGRDMRAFLEHVEAQRVVAPREPEAPIDSEDAEAVRLMTIHAAKGLEADLVCVADLGRLRMNNEKPYLLADGDRLGVCVPLPDGAFADALDYADLRTELRAAESAEEDRVLYVAMTRARERLLLSGAIDIARWPNESATSSPLTWLGPALVDAIQARLAELAARPRGGFVDLEATADPAQVRMRLTLNAPAAAAPAAAAAATASPEPNGATAEPVGAKRRWRPAPPASPPPVAPAALSYTALSDYAACGYRYYLERVLGFAELPDDVAGPAATIHGVTGPDAGADTAAGLEPRVRGTIVHELLEQLDFGDPYPPDDEAIRGAAARAGAEPHPADIEQLRDLVAAFARSPLRARLAAGARVAREQPFAFVLEEPGDSPLINGYLDVVAHERDGALLVVDYKTDAVAAETDLEQLTEHDYGAQRLAYALAGLASGAPEIEVAHCFLERPEQLVSARYAATDAPRLRERLRELASGIFLGRFDVAPSPHRQLCAGCPGRPRLCSWELEMTGRELRDGSR